MGNLWKECLDCESNCCKMDVAHPLFVTEEEVECIKTSYPDKFHSFNKFYPCSCLSESGLCEIHEKKPIDCRLFPFDVIRHNDGFLWIIREISCSILQDGKKFEEYLQDFEANIIPGFYRHLEKYAEFRSEELAGKYGFRILREVRVIG